MTAPTNALSNFEKVQEFNNAMGVEHSMSGANVLLRLKLMEEEWDEVSDELAGYSHVTNKVEALGKYDVKRLAKELADLLYVVYGAADAFDIPIDLVFDDVHSSNMSKLGADGRPIRREDGKVMKGPNYRPPDLSYIDV